MSYEYDAGAGYRVSDDASLLDIDTIHDYLSHEAYWAIGRTRSAVVRSIEHSLNFGVYGPGNVLVGFARVVTDMAVFAYICDVFVLPEYRGHGLSKALMAAMLDHPDLRDVQRWFLFTRDAHGLYAQFGFQALAAPERAMDRLNQAPHVSSILDARELADEH
jgi:N-acetylglutamate synthase-like GNAT family acetyltransferase